jgi:hypothetical protein
MARRGSELRQLKYFALIGLILFAAWLINQLLSAASEAIDVPPKFIVLGAIAFLLVCLIALVSYRRRKAKRVRESLFVKVASVTERHLPTLTKKGPCSFVAMITGGPGSRSGKRNSVNLFPEIFSRYCRATNTPPFNRTWETFGALLNVQ